jgi:hypothetical protein
LRGSLKIAGDYRRPEKMMLIILSLAGPFAARAASRSRAGQPERREENVQRDTARGAYQGEP